MDLVKDLALQQLLGSQGDWVKGLDAFIGEFFEFTPQRNEPAVKAMQPFVLKRGDFEGRRELEEALDLRRQQRGDVLVKRFTNVYVRNIPDAWQEADLRDSFEPFGLILSMSVQDDRKGRGRFGMVNFAEVDQAEAAVAGLHDHVVDTGDRQLKLYVQRCQNQSERVDFRCRGYVEQLREDLAAVLQMQAKAREDPPTTPSDFLCWFALHKWRPEKAFAGACLETFAELARTKFGEAAPKRATRFAEGVSDVNVWKSKGSPYVYPSAVFKMLNRFGESDIELLHKNPTATATVCVGCSCPRIVGREDPNDQVWRCVACFIAWYGWYPWTDAGVEKLAERGGAMGHSPKGKKGNKSKKGNK